MDGRERGRARVRWQVAAVGALVVAVLAVPGAAHAAAPTLSVDANASRHPISPYIYGLNFASAAQAADLNLPVDRWGGNATDTYNWKLSASNTGQDYYYENISDCFDAAYSYCANGRVYGYRQFIQKDRQAGADSLITVPTMGYVANSTGTAHPFTCGFPATLFASQDSFDPYDSNCGNGLHNGSPLASDPTRDGAAISPTFDANWVTDMKSRYGSASAGGVALYELGNEPALWSSTHRDMHPAPETYDELWQKTRDYGNAVRAVDPSAGILGFSEWGWPNYFCSGADDTSNGCSATDTDRAAHGGTPLVEWLLQQARRYQRKHGVRLFDYLDLHYYAQGGSTTDVTRSLWDPTYTDPSWINAKIDLIPRMKQWIANDYPGTKTSLSEYNLSVGTPAVNALIQGDTLGIFGREGLDLATRWSLGNDGSLIDDAFRMYRNYDGNGSAFGNVSIGSASTDQSQLAVYGAQQGSSGAYTIMVINKTTGALTSQLSLSHVNPGGSAQVYQWTAANHIQHLANRSVPPAGFSATYPARSMTLYVIPSA